MFTPVPIKNEVSINAKECFIPALALPSESLPIVNPLKKPCIKSKYKNEFATS